MSNLDLDAMLDPCGCCEGLPPISPRYNRPGLSEIQYRLGTYSDFFSQLLADISRFQLPSPSSGSLKSLKTRAPDDATIAFLDAWAVVADVLTFYQERIANEGYLGTATERRSVLELARAIGYELSPGLAASTYLAFTVDDTAETKTVIVPQGTQAQSLIPDRPPQIFETSADCNAKVEWNEIRPRLTQPQQLVLNQSNQLCWQRLDGKLTSTNKVFVQEPNLNLVPGDLLLLRLPKVKNKNNPQVKKGSPLHLLFATIKDIEPLPEKRQTCLALEITKFSEPSQNPQTTKGASGRAEVYAFRNRLGFFGNTAPTWASLPSEQRQQRQKPADPYQDDWDAPGWDIWNAYPKSKNIYKKVDGIDVYLERIVPGIAPGSWVVFTDGSHITTYKVNASRESAVVGFSLALRTTGLILEGVQTSIKYKVRRTTAYVQSESLTLADLPIEDDIGTVSSGDCSGATSLTLDRSFPDLQIDQPIAIKGEQVAPEGVERSEIAFIKDIKHYQGYTTLFFKEQLQYCYRRPTVTLNANVVPATHGETVEEVLGYGDGSKTHQQFQLKKPPLTYVSASTPSGGESTLQVRVNDILWQEVPSLYGLPPNAENFIVRHEDDGSTRALFGDGKQGARLPTGVENITATYRSGLGLQGEVPADSINLLLQTPFGISSVTNPIPASGGADAERLSQARQNAPLTVLTLNRLVSLKDYENFARAFSGIGKAQAIALWDGSTTRVHLTVASESDQPLKTSADVFLNLRDEIKKLQDPGQSFMLDSYEPCYFKLKASLTIDPRYKTTEVLARVKASLLEVFSFANRDFGQGVSAAEVIALIQSIEGAIAVDLDLLHRMDKSSKPDNFLEAATARWKQGEASPKKAELLLLNSKKLITLEEKQS